jgi:hypothetical protein
VHRAHLEAPTKALIGPGATAEAAATLQEQDVDPCVGELARSGDAC